MAFETVPSVYYYSLWFIIRSHSNYFHLLQVFVGMVRMDHLVLHRDIITTKEFDCIASGMDKIRNVVDDSFDGNFGAI